MFDKFNFYDFLGYLLPGAAVVLMVYWVGKLAFGIPFPVFQGDLATSFVFLGASYVAGHLVQGLGSIYERSLRTTRNGRLLRLSEWLLLCPPGTYVPSQDQFTKGLIARIYTAADVVFKAKKDSDQEGEIFEQAYALLVQKGLVQHVEVFLAMTGLARGMLAATGLAVVVAEAVVLTEFVLASSWPHGVAILEIASLRYSPTALALSLAALPALAIVAWLFRREFDRFRYYFAKSVYWNFLAWYGSQNMEKDAGPE